MTYIKKTLVVLMMMVSLGLAVPGEVNAGCVGMTKYQTFYTYDSDAGMTFANVQAFPGVYCSLTYEPYTSQGYSCNRFAYDNSSMFWYQIDCVKNVPAQYVGQTLSSYAIRGVYNPAVSDSQTPYYDFGVVSCPHLYLHNTPAGTVSITPDSDLDIFKTEQPFTLGNTWLLSSADGEVSLDGEEVDHLFYRLAIEDLTLSRHGRNFASRAEVIDYLKSSDFFSKLGFSAEERTNSLETIIGDIEANPASPYYYLTVLDEASINQVSKLAIDPAPADLIRSYFAVYPTPVPVKTEGDFIFPAIKTIGTEYTVKETGELLLGPDTFVSFK